MGVVFTAVFRVKDWQALRRLSDVTLIAFARAAGARSYRLYRNAHDAAEALLIVEGATLDALQIMRSALMQRADPAIIAIAPGARAEPPEGKLWEPAECSAIG
jgi:hypothetical protein